jgi:hypothetical protein
MNKKSLDRIRELAGMATVQEDTTLVGTMYQIRDKLTESGLDYNPAKGGYNDYDNAGSDTCDQCGCDIDSPEAGCDCTHSITEDETDPKVAEAIAVLDAAIENEMEFDADGGYGDDDTDDDGEEFGPPELVQYFESLKSLFLKGDVPTTAAHIEKIGSAMDKIVDYGDGDTIQDILLELAEAFGIDTDLDEASKPDFADIDDDGDTDETAKKAAKDADDEPMTEQQQMREWSNSVYKNYEDRGHIQAQPEGETVDNSLRRYLNADPHKVQVSESHTPKKLSASYKTFKGK